MLLSLAIFASEICTIFVDFCNRKQEVLTESFFLCTELNLL